MRSQLQRSRLSLRPTTCVSCQMKLLHASSTTRTATQVTNRKRTDAVGTPLIQKRHITQQHIRRTNEAKEQWARWAEEIKAGKKQSFLSLLEERGLINSVVGERDVLDKLITNKRVGFYAGVDPTAPSLHIGHMLPFMILGWAYVHGMKAVWLLGGTTAKIGDPTGRTDTRPIMKSSIRKANIANLHLQLKKLGLSFEKYGGKYGYEYEWAWRRVLENNNTWWNKEPLAEVLTTLGSAVRLGPMLGRDNVKSRMESGGGMSLAEFCYPVMQAWDFWYLFKHGTQIQVGGSDQYGNILFGIDAIKGILKNDPHSEFAPKANEDPDLVNPIGITTPLLTTSSGVKFGKSAGNAVWLDKDMTSTYDLYQVRPRVNDLEYFVRLPDSEVERYLKLFTFIPIPQIKELMEQHVQDPSKRVAQHKLAREFVELIHGAKEAEQAAKQHRTIFMSKFSTGNRSATETDEACGTGLSEDEPRPQKLKMFEVPSPHVTLPRSLVVNQFFHKVLWSAGLVESKAEGFRKIVRNGVHVASRADSNQVMGDAISYIPVKTWPPEITEKFIIDDSLMILKIGKWNIKIIKIVSDQEYEKLGLSAPGWNERDTYEERQADKELFKSKQKIDGHRVKLPLFAQTPKPEIKTWKPGQEEPILRAPEDRHVESGHKA
ncbi:tyrosyl-tRNA synthetase [Emydomyces testavorans]|uniref:Tyrosine--tRNA ligase n=1 Tax=Emydomyces testavorans TaxID=2070801 RepID=A0AAF0IIV6_9EURO|nr:tyrosyl-tRNA synthetase [Emydomyces testavorans]